MLISYDFLQRLVGIYRYNDGLLEVNVNSTLFKLVFKQLDFDILFPFVQSYRVSGNPRDILVNRAMKVFNAIFTSIIESAAKEDVKADLNVDLIKMLEEAYFIFHNIFMSRYFATPAPGKYEKVKNLLGFTMI